MEGPKNSSSAKDRGIIARVAEQMVQHIKQQSKKENIEYAVSASYLEIYQEQLKDLLCEEETASNADAVAESTRRALPFFFLTPLDCVEYR